MINPNIRMYERYFIGQDVQPKNWLAMESPEMEERNALDIIRYAIEHLLEWDAETARHYFNYEYVKKLKLEPVYKRVQIPQELDPIAGAWWIVFKLYPRHYSYYDVNRKLWLDLFDRVRNRECQWPRDYFADTSGTVKLAVYLNQLLYELPEFHNLEEMYQFSASTKFMKMLRANRLDQICNNTFETPVDYLDASLPASMRNPMYLYNYHLLYFISIFHLHTFQV